MKPTIFRILRFLHGVLVWACAIGGYNMIAASVFANMTTDWGFKIAAVFVALIDFVCIILIWRIFAIEFSIYECLHSGAMFSENARPLRKIGGDFYCNKDRNDPFFLHLPWALVGFVYFVAATTICSFLPKTVAIAILIMPEAFAVAVVLTFTASIINMRLQRWGMDRVVICIKPGLFTSVCRAREHYRDVKDETSKSKSTAP